MISLVFFSLIFLFGALNPVEAGYAISPVSVLFGVFATLLDVLVSFIQAYVFTRSARHTLAWRRLELEEAVKKKEITE